MKGGLSRGASMEEAFQQRLKEAQSAPPWAEVPCERLRSQARWSWWEKRAPGGGDSCTETLKHKMAGRPLDLRSEGWDRAVTGQRQKELPRPPGPSLSLVRARLGAGEAPSQRQRHLNVWVVIYGTKTQPPEVRVTQCLSRCASTARGLFWSCQCLIRKMGEGGSRGGETAGFTYT